MDFNFLDTMLIVLSLLLMAVPGFILVKTKLIGESAIKSVSTITLSICQPLLVLSIFQKNDYNPALNQNLLIMVGFSFLIYFLFIGISKVIFIPFRSKDPELNLLKKGENRVYAFACTFANCGFMGIPIVEALIPNNPEVMLYTALMLVVFNTVAFTIGIFSITGDKKHMRFRWAFLNPTMIAVYLGLILFFTKVKFPTFIASPIHTLGNLCIPLSMLMLGMRFAYADLKKVLKSVGVYITCVVKLILVPVVMWLILLPFKSIAEEIRIVLIITSAMPTASITLMFTEAYDQDSFAASSSILLTTILSIVTVPVILILLL